MSDSTRRKYFIYKYDTQVELLGEHANKIFVYLKFKFCNKRVSRDVKRLKDDFHTYKCWSM
ncbi:hypothetical protein KFK09_007901 [Dendrobium nobile]|uniref:Uncharacterized protein n=1 Tax=Dendrobium nobile TaxID=94219 RepID=A0A8T3BWG0_DENNO|nr:hypothetical protein KFK09_007901 [Dendrobium nobile]